MDDSIKTLYHPSSTEYMNMSEKEKDEETERAIIRVRVIKEKITSYGYDDRK